MQLAIVDRVVYAVLGAALGLLIGGACWWLYGLAHSLNYDGPGMDPVLRHWLTWAAAVFATTGLLLRQRVTRAVGDTFKAIFHFELDSTPDERWGAIVALVFLVIVVAAIWFSVPGRPQG
ncbi:MAG: hypothetical protein IV085_00475 [Thiobacillus sp.]|nr:hypothetical protein [Thiobacillus sp.]